MDHAKDKFVFRNDLSYSWTDLALVKVTTKGSVFSYAITNKHERNIPWTSIRPHLVKRYVNIQQTLGSRMVRVHALKTLNEYLRAIVRNAQKIAVNNIKKESLEEIDIDDLRNWFLMQRTILAILKRLLSTVGYLVYDRKIFSVYYRFSYFAISGLYRWFKYSLPSAWLLISRNCPSHVELTKWSSHNTELRLRCTGT